MFSYLIKRLIPFLCCIFCIYDALGCTSAIVSASASSSGRPMLWKHRDTSTTDNKIEFVEGKDGEYSYVALFNAGDVNLEEAWIGMNQMGFAIMNTASYNIKNDNVPASKMDKEGFLMSKALKSCVTVDDFEKFLELYPRPMGVEANFGVIDAYGNGACFETNNDSFVKFDLKDAPGGVIIRTNYSHSGRQGEGYGHIREANATHLLTPYIAERNISPELLTENISRNFYHDVRKKDALEETEMWIVDEDFIPRYKSTATVVIEGIIPLSAGTSVTKEMIIPEYIMWTGLGYPPCAEIYPVWCHRGGVDENLRGIDASFTSPAGNLARKRRNSVFSYPIGKSKNTNVRYINRSVLKNTDDTGFIQQLVPRNLKVYEIVKRKRENGEIHFD